MAWTVFSGGALILTHMDGAELPNPVNADIVKKYFVLIYEKKSVVGRKPERAAWAKMRFPVDRKLERAIQAK